MGVDIISIFHELHNNVVEFEQETCCEIAGRHRGDADARGTTLLRWKTVWIAEEANYTDCSGLRIGNSAEDVVLVTYSETDQIFYTACKKLEVSPK